MAIAFVCGLASLQTAFPTFYQIAQPDNSAAVLLTAVSFNVAGEKLSKVWPQNLHISA